YADSMLDTVTFASPSEFEYKDSFPHANLVMVNGEFNMMARSYEGGIDWYGGVASFDDSVSLILFDEPFHYIKLPLNYLDKNQDSFSFSFTNKLGPNMNMLVNQNQIRNYIVNGYGKLKMRNQIDYEVLRIKITEVDSTIIAFKTPMGTNETRQMSYSYYYEFWAKGYGQPLLRIEVDSADHSKPINMEILDMEKTSVGLGKIKNEELILYPNPSNGWVKLSSRYKGATVSFYDAWGRKQVNLNQSSEIIDISQLPSGFYSVVVSDYDGTVLCTKKLIKK
ncbi:MAG: T9SS type A sorting domain-containing protein, partial [Bacteroidetes bacterium]|nr:T9SS type A sorting domain-containing protein [Bacteroidota bacterium]